MIKTMMVISDEEIDALTDALHWKSCETRLTETDTKLMRRAIAVKKVNQQ